MLVNKRLQSRGTRWSTIGVEDEGDEGGFEGATQNDILENVCGG